MIEVIGITIAIATACDFSLKKRKKLVISRFITSFGSDTKPLEHNGYQHIQKFFGPALFSKRAILISLVLSILSLILSYLYAFLTSDYNIIWIFEKNISFLTICFFALFLIGSIIGDIASYAQTRLFLKTIDNYKTGIISIGLALADIVISLTVFVFIFSFTRLFAYMVIVAGLSGGELNSRQMINLELLKTQIPTLIEKGLVRNGEAELIEYLAKADKNNISVIENYLRLYNEQVVGSFHESGDYTIQAKVDCAPIGSEGLAFNDTAQLISKTVAAYRGINELHRGYKIIFDDISLELKNWNINKKNIKNPNCAYQTLMIQRTMSAGRLLDIAGPSNAWWAAFQMTTRDAYESIAYKFATYAHVDPFNDIDEYYRSIIFQSGFSLFDLTYADPTIPYLLSEFKYTIPKDSEKLRAPFSPMLGSALAVSLLFWVYILLIYTSKGFIIFGDFFNNLISKFDIRLAPITSLVLVLIGTWFMFKIIFSSIDIFWRLIF